MLCPVLLVCCAVLCLELASLTVLQAELPC